MRLLSVLLLIIAPFTCAKQTTLRFVTEDLPPYQVVESNKLVAGSSFELVKKAITLSNLNSEVELYPWARAFEMDKNIPNIVIFSMARTEERESHFLWLYKLKPLRYRFYSSSKNNYDQRINLDDLQGIIAATVRGSFEETSLKQLGFKHKKNLVITKNYEEMWTLLDERKVDIVYAAHMPYTAKVKNKHSFVAHQRIIKKYDLYIAANKDSNKVLIERFKRALLEIK